jgi:hypothetical protein
MPKQQPAPQPDPSGWTVSESDWAHLHGRVDTLESSVRIVAAGHQLLAEQMAEITVSQHRSGQRLDKISTELADNSKTTREILGATRDLRDVVITARTGGKFARWLAPTLVAGALSFGVIKGWWTDLTDLVLKK